MNHNTFNLWLMVAILLLAIIIVGSLEIPH